MQRSPSQFGRGIDSRADAGKSRGVLAWTGLTMIGAVAMMSVYTFWRVDRVQENVELVNQFYVPVLKHLNVLSGKWSAYQRSFEQSVAFRKWGTSSHDRTPMPKLHLRKMIDPNLNELSRRALTVPPGRFVPEVAALKSLVVRLSESSEREAGQLAEIASLVKARHLNEAASAYARARQENMGVSQALLSLSRDVENRLSLLQVSTEDELHSSRSMMVLLFGASVLFTLVVLFRLRRWLQPIWEWTRVAQEIALKGITRDVRFPQITRGMPPEISLLTREFTRMGTTVLERERTIHQQKDKLASLNEHLKEQNGMLRKLGGLNERILNSMSSGLLVLGPTGNVEQFNERYCELFDTDRKMVLGHHASEVLVAWPVELVDAWLGAAEPRRESRLKLGRRVFDVSVQQLHDAAGRLLLFEDVTQVVDAERKLEHARALVLAGNMSSQVAHEVRNPLNSMSLQLDMLEDDLGAEPNSPALARIAAVSEQVQRLERITRRYLDVGRAALTSKGEQPRREPVSIHGLVEKCLGFLSAEIQAARVTVELDLRAPEHAVAGDADALSQVVFNLARNALEALSVLPAGADRRLRISTTSEGGIIRVRVADNGRGVSAEVSGRLFEPFVTDKAAGHGLGLSVSRQICIEHGGELKWISEAAGGVFEFSVKGGFEGGGDAHPHS